MKKIKLIFVFVLLAVILSMTSFYVYSEDIAAGCCANPGAGLLTCYTGTQTDQERLSQIGECCPEPVSSYGSYYDGLVGGPTTYDNCLSNFFLSGKSCSDPSIKQCEEGCCCTTIGKLKGEKTSKILCQSQGQEFRSLLAGDNCINVCQVPECSDGMDNDGNGCIDYPSDPGCLNENSNEADTQGRTCLNLEGADCSSINYIPKINNFRASLVKGGNKVRLDWESECADDSNNPVYHEISRCKGIQCLDFIPLDTITQNTFLDEDSQLNFQAAYTYKIKSFYDIQNIDPEATTTISTGDIECWNKLDNNNFCIHESYYNQYEDYLVAKFVGFNTNTFLDNVRTTFSNNLNKAHFCDDNNKLQKEGTECLGSQVCVISNNQPLCIEKTECNPDQTNLFGLFYTRPICEDNKYCFYDRSLSTIDSCFKCDSSMSCYDYKSQSSCQRDNCFVGDCAWKPLSQELGTGACINENENNCQFCDSAGTEGLESTQSTSSIFEQCTEQKSELLSSSENKCYYNGDSALNCNDVKCADYSPGQCSNFDITHNQFNIITNPSNDHCNLKICQNFNNICKKNADGDNIADCNGDFCEKDVFAPYTTIIPIKSKGIYKSLSINILDKSSSASPSTRRTSSDYKTYICKEPCASNGHPYTNFTTAQNMLISNLDLYDSITGEKLAVLEEGDNTLRYYSQDPSKNIGEVDTVSFTAYQDSSGPEVFNFKVTNGLLTNNIIYTNSLNPILTVEFYDNAIITSAKLKPKNTNSLIELTYPSNIAKVIEFNLLQPLNPGSYIFEFNAKNNKGISMDSPYIIEIVIDNTNPSVTIQPSAVTIQDNSNIPFTITFDGITTLETVLIGTGLILDPIISGGTTYTAGVMGSDGFTNEFTTSDGTTYRVVFIEGDGTGYDTQITSSDGTTYAAGVMGVSGFTTQTITINGVTYTAIIVENLAGQFTTEDGSTYSAVINLIDGNKEIVVVGVDNAGNTVTDTTTFIVNVNPLKISLINPSFGVSPTFTFNITVGTDNDAECRYSLNNNLQFEDMNQFDSTGGIEHKKDNFDGIADGDISINNLYVRCNDPLQRPGIEVFELVVEPNKPKIITAYTFPEPIVEEPRKTALKIQTDLETICKYSKIFEDFPSMENKVAGFDNSTFSKINTQAITVDKDGSYEYFVSCMSRADIISKTEKISFSSDITLPLEIISTTNPYFSAKTVVLGVQTNKHSPCKYSKEDSSVIKGTSFGSSGYSHTKTLVLDSGSHSYYVTCRDRYFESWADPVRIDFTIDLAPPNMVFVDDKSTLLNNPEFTWHQDRLRVKWLGNDNESGIKSYQYTLEEFGTLNTIINWTTNYDDEDDWIWATNDNNSLNLLTGSKYFFRVKAKNMVDLESEPMNSDGITIDPSLKSPICSNGKKDTQESDIDCGGPCDLCADNSACNSNIDCFSGFCGSDNICKTPTCADNANNQDESDIDCGGSCNACDNDKNCNINTDCSSSLCSFGICKEVDICNDGKLSGSESDIDCGGPCPDKCQVGKSCAENSDCILSLTCNSGKCSKEIEDDPDKDTDGDGIPDRWELQQGMDPNDPSDAELDMDNDLLTNLEEYLVKTKWGKSADPLKKDTDGDGASDKKEMLKGTNPLDPLSKPKGIGSLLWILILILLLAGGGYGGYYYYEYNINKKQLTPLPKTLATKKPSTKTLRKKLKEDMLFKIREEEKRNRREKMFDIFGKKKTEKGASIKKTKLISKKSLSKTPKKEIKQKEDTFSKLKLISKNRGPLKSKDPEVIKKLRKIAKGKKSSKKPNKKR